MAQYKTLKNARAVFVKAFKEDSGFRDGYISNIAMVMHDCQPKGSRGLNMRNPEVRNAVAARILKHILE